MNSIQKDALGNYLISSRHTHAVYYVDGKTEKISWILGGKQSTFKGSGTSFAWQHLARFINENGVKGDDLEQRMRDGKRYISLYNNDNAGFSTHRPYSSGWLIELDFRKKTATRLRSYHNPGGEKRLSSESQGSLEIMSNYSGIKTDHVIMGYGSLPVWAEYTEDGKTVQVVHYGESKTQGYQIKKLAWQGFPATAPDVAIHKGSLYTSWNGATEVAKWAIWQSKDAKDIGKNTNKTIVPRKGFETEVPIDKSFSIFQVEALDKNDCSLGKSNIINGENKAQGEKSVKGITPDDYKAKCASKNDSKGSSDSKPGSYSEGKKSGSSSSKESGGLDLGGLRSGRDHSGANAIHSMSPILLVVMCAVTTSLFTLI